MKFKPLLNILSPPKNNTKSVVLNLAQYLGLLVTSKTIDEELEKHPEYGSMLGISEVLRSWNIETLALNVHDNELNKVKLPFITSIKNKDSSFILVTRVEGNEVSYLLDNKPLITEARETFTEKWSGAVLMVNANEASGEEEYSVNKRNDLLNTLRLPFIYLSFLSLFLISLASMIDADVPVSYYYLLSLKLLGTFISILLLNSTFGAGNSLVKSICSFGKKVNCSSVLNSSGSKLWGWLSWTEMGFIYFAGSLLAILLLGDTLTLRTTLMVTTALALPYSFFSVYYQARVVKQWCILCLCIQGIFWLEFAALWKDYSQVYFRIDVQDLNKLLWSFVLPVLGWSLLKPYLKYPSLLGKVKTRLNRLKGNREVFSFLLSNQVTAPVEEILLNPIVIGNRDAQHTITLVNNPYCYPGSIAHRELDKILLVNDNVKIQLILTVFKEDDMSAMTTHHFLSLYEEKGEEYTRHALHEWFSSRAKDYRGWAEKHPVAFSPESTTQIIRSHKEWCLKNEVYVTPTVFVDNHKMPPEFEIEDIKYLVSGLEVPILTSVTG